MEAINICYVRLETGENIAQYTSSGQSPPVGAILDLSFAGTTGIFEVQGVKVTHFIGHYQIILLTVRPSSLPDVVSQNSLGGEAGNEAEIMALTPAYPVFRAILEKPRLLGLVVAALIVILLRFLKRNFKIY